MYPLKGSHTVLPTYSETSGAVRGNDIIGDIACEYIKAPRFVCIGHALNIFFGPFLLENIKKRRNKEEFFG